jgi:DNA-binding transcriptional MerR regulator
MDERELFDIGDVARRSGFAPSALRFYEQKGLIESVERHGLRRQYPSTVFLSLGVIAACRQAGFSLEEIHALLATKGDLSWKGLVAQKLDSLRRLQEKLEATCTVLEHALECESKTVLTCPNFHAHVQDALPVAASSRSLHYSNTAQLLE